MLRAVVVAAAVVLVVCLSESARGSGVPLQVRVSHVPGGAVEVPPLGEAVHWCGGVSAAEVASDPSLARRYRPGHCPPAVLLPHEALEDLEWKDDYLDSLLHRVVTMFEDSFNAYIDNAYPQDELLPLTCKGTNTFGGFGISHVEALSTIAIMPEMHHLWSSEVDRLVQRLSKPEEGKESFFDVSMRVDVFEMNIRWLGGLLTVYEHGSGALSMDGEEDPLLLPQESLDIILDAAIDLADRLLPAFNTKTGIPLPTVNLRHGVTKIELGTPETLVAAGGSFLLEFSTLSYITGDGKYEIAAKKAVSSLISLASPYTGLLGSRVNVVTGEWHDPRASISSQDSFLEYVFKYSILARGTAAKRTWADSWEDLLESLEKYSFFTMYWIDVHMDSGMVLYPYFYSLASFWPGTLALARNVPEAEASFRAVSQLWRYYGGLPEVQNIQKAGTQPLAGMENYPLRPEAIESAYYLHVLSANPEYRWFGAAAVEALEGMRGQCGFAGLSNVMTREHNDVMPSYFFAETLKYLYLLFSDSPLASPQALKQVVFSTEGHVLSKLKKQMANRGRRLRDEL